MYTLKAPFTFFISMLAISVIIITVWLLACSILLNIPLFIDKPFDSLGFVFGYTWGYFASSWALLALLQPDLSNFMGFFSILNQHLQHAPGLYTLHLVFFTALIGWSICLFKGLIARTYRARTFIKITAFLLVLLLLFSLIFLLFSDVFIIQ